MVKKPVLQYSFKLRLGVILVKVSNLNVTKTIEEVTTLLEKEKRISPVLKAAIQLLLTVVTLLAERLCLCENITETKHTYGNKAVESPSFTTFYEFKIP